MVNVSILLVGGGVKGLGKKTSKVNHLTYPTVFLLVAWVILWYPYASDSQVRFIYLVIYIY